ncbi:MAG: hypothetical protein MK322_12600 [Pseudomonadales bacterium]|nr:hypothetical protein [Pseudomonadales bacterium]
MTRIKVLILIFSVFFVAGCTTTEKLEIKASPQQKTLFTGHYVQTIEGLGVVELYIDSNLDYIWTQPIPFFVKRTSRGTLKVTSLLEAKAGRVRLKWISRNSVVARSPHGSSMDWDNSGGNSQITVGADFRLWRQ